MIMYLRTLQVVAIFYSHWEDAQASRKASGPISGDRGVPGQVPGQRRGRPISGDRRGPGPISGDRRIAGQISGLFNSVFVDSSKGINSNLCGSQKLPCKDITVGIKHVKDYGTLFVTGAHLLNKTITFTKSITMTSDMENKANIKGNGSILFAFKVEIPGNLREYLRVKISNIQFDTIGILRIDLPGQEPEKSPNLQLENITIEHTRRLLKSYSIRISRISYREQMSPPLLSIRNSIFQDISPLRLVAGNIRIQNCTFNNSYSSAGAKGGSSRCVEMMGVNSVVFEGSTFIGCKHRESGGAIAITDELFLYMYSYSSANSVIINQCSFVGCSSEDGGGAVYLKSVIEKVELIASNFTRCTASTGGAISIVDTPEPGKVRGCTARTWGVIRAGDNSQNYVEKCDATEFTPETISIRKCQFVENEARLGGGIYLRNNQKVKIEDTVFLDNKAVTFGQAIYNSGSLVLKNIVTICLVNNSVNQMHVQGDFVSIQDLYIETRNRGLLQSNMIRHGVTVSSKRIVVTGHINYVCPVYFRSIVERSFYVKRDFKGDKAITTLLAVSCESCETDTYTLSTGILKAKSISKGRITDRLNITKSNGVCLKCPSGGVCRGNIKPLDNYWGYLESDAEVKFVQCPPSFCCSSLTTPCTSFNTCNIGRRGTLCGSCDIGYSQSFISNGCVKKDEISCSINVFIGYFIAVSLFYTIIFTFLPSMISGIKKLVGERRGTTEDHVTAKENENLQGKEEFQNVSTQQSDGDPEAPSEEIDERSKKSGEKSPVVTGTRVPTYVVPPCVGPPPLSAYITLIAFFFQVASLVHVKMQQRQKIYKDKNPPASESEFQNILFDLFNFRITVSRTLCPTDELTLPVKEFINVALKIISVSNLVLFYVAGKMISILRSCSGKTIHHDKVSSVELDSQQTSKRRDDDDHMTNGTQKDERPKQELVLSFNSRLKIGFIKLVKLNFTSITTFCFHMISCVEIGENLHLYLYGDQKCYVWWQKIILSAVLPIVLVFPASFGMALNLIKDELISTNQFLLGSVMPIYTMYLLVKKRVTGLTKACPTEDEEMCVVTILEMEEVLFKTDNDFWRWTVIQLYRNVLIVLLNVFILNPIYRCIFFICVFGIFAIHDRLRQPYEHPYLNHIQLLSSLSLLILSACNIPASFSLTFDVMSVPHMRFITAVLQSTEITMYIVVPSSLVIWMVTQKIHAKRGEAQPFIRDSRRESVFSHFSGHLSIF